MWYVNSLYVMIFMFSRVCQYVRTKHKTLIFSTRDLHVDVDVDVDVVTGGISGDTEN